MINPDRNPLKDITEIDETEMSFRFRHDPADGPKGDLGTHGRGADWCSRAAVQRNLVWMEAQGLTRAVTGQGRFRMWRIPI